MDTVLSVLYQFGTNASFLLLSAIGLIVILGMMNIINLAHGELMMIGAYVASSTYHVGIPLVFCIVIAFFAVGIVGVFLERLLIRWFLGRELMAMVVTWGLSLIIAQGTLLLLGPYLASIPIPFGPGAVGTFKFGFYQLLLIAVAIGLPVALWWLYYHTNFGLRARATMQQRAMAQALGVRVGRVYTMTFGLGCGLAGFAGALLAPLTTISPYMGHQYVGPAFITVVTGGSADVIIGALASAGLLSLIATPVAITLGTFLGVVAMLCASLVLIRMLPNGLSEWIQRHWMA